MASPFSTEAQLRAITDTLTRVADALDLGISVQLWNGQLIPLGSDPDPNLVVKLAGPGVVGLLLRRPTAENLLRLYATGAIELVGGNLMEFREAVRMSGSSRQRMKALPKWPLLRNGLPFLFARARTRDVQNAFTADAIGRQESRRNNRDYIQFHYDVGNEFYKLFLDDEMQYSCGYFTNRDNSLDRAQLDKLDMICRKLRLAPGETLLDIGCGWGGLICHAAQHYGVRSHGITLSQQQHDLAHEKIRRLGLDNQVTVEICDYSAHQGSYDKIASIGMFEHIGVTNYPKYFQQARSLLRDKGIFLNHAIARSAKRTRRKARYVRPERRLLLKYIFPGSELTSIGFTSDAMEHEGFEVHDVEAWREHYALTCKAWCERLTARRQEAVELVGAERYRLWVAYLAGAACGFADGGIKIYQVVATKRAKGPSGLPLTRADLYDGARDRSEPLAALV